MSIKETAFNFFDACETGRGWEGCRDFCTSDASFSAQAGILGEVTTAQDYTEWMKGVLVPTPGAHYEILGFAVDEDRDTVVAAAVFNATHTAEGGPVPPTGKTVAADYCYVMQFTGDKISHLTKIWNDGHSMQQLGWA